MVIISQTKVNISDNFKEHNKNESPGPDLPIGLPGYSL